MIEWPSHFHEKPKKAFITHGEPESARSMKKAVESALGWDCVTPKYLDKFDL
jgi:metallo-beta-lactamase family protein